MFGALALAMILAVDGTDAGTVPDRPTVTRLSTGEYLFSAPAYNAVDAEMRRLQDSVSALEAEKARAAQARKDEPGWFPIVLVSVLTGLAVGVSTGFLVGLAVPK